MLISEHEILGGFTECSRPQKGVFKECSYKGYFGFQISYCTKTISFPYQSRNWDFSSSLAGILNLKGKPVSVKQINAIVKIWTNHSITNGPAGFQFFLNRFWMQPYFHTFFKQQGQIQGVGWVKLAPPPPVWGHLSFKLWKRTKLPLRQFCLWLFQYHSVSSVPPPPQKSWIQHWTIKLLFKLPFCTLQLSRKRLKMDCDVNLNVIWSSWVDCYLNPKFSLALSWILATRQLAQNFARSPDNILVCYLFSGLPTN